MEVIDIMILGIRNREDVDPRVLEIEAARRAALLNTIVRSFRNPNNAFAWVVITWTLSFLIISAFTGVQASVALSCVLAVVLAGYRRRYCIE